MRIIGGSLAGRKIKPPRSRTTRPMMDRTRQALFNILEHNDWGLGKGNLFAATDLIDAFCGTGALALESLSRGARHAFLFDKDVEALTVAKENAHTLGLSDRCTVDLTDALKPRAAPRACQLIFLAPPYRKGLIAPAYKALASNGWIAEKAVIVAETARKEEWEKPEGLTLNESRFYADTGLHFLTR